VSPKDKPLVWLHGQIKTPPMSREARIEAGYLLRRLQRGDKLSMPHSRSMPNVSGRCHELRVGDANVTWRIVYRIDADAIVIAEVFGKKSRTTPQSVIESCRKRLKEYDDAS
jgi:phage-related protein